MSDKRSEKRASPWLWVFCLLLLAGIGALTYGAFRPRLQARAAATADAEDRATPIVSVIHPERSSPEQEIVLPANIQAFIDAPIYARTNGYLQHWYVDIGAHVTSGQLLAEIDTPEVEQQLQQARADLATAEANSRLAQITNDRYADLLKTHSVAQQEADNANGNLEARRTVVQSAQHNVKRLEELQAFQKIFAPFDGVITARNTDIGALINSGNSSGNSGTARELFHIAATNQLRVYVSVPQAYWPAAKLGLKADLTLPEFPGRRFHGSLVRTSDAIDAASRTMLVEVDVDNPSGELKPGAYAEIRLMLPSKSSTFLLPVNAFLFRTEGIQIAMVKADGHAVLSSVALGRDFGTKLEVLSGLHGEETVIVNPPDSLQSGQAVKMAGAGK